MNVTTRDLRVGLGGYIEAVREGEKVFICKTIAKELRPVAQLVMVRPGYEAGPLVKIEAGSDG